MGQRVTFPANGRQTTGYLAQPQGGGKAPGVIVIQEWWGLVPQIERVCDRLADAGFAALAPDLFHGETAKAPDQAGKLMMAMNIGQTEQDLRGAVKYLLGQPFVSGRKVGTVGFCMGGALSLFAASKNPEVGACVVFYGGHPNVQPDLLNLQAPVLGLYGGKDGFVTPDAVHQLDAELTRLGKRHEFHTYANADHAFANEEGPNYNAAATKDAWERTVKFLRSELK